MMQLTDDEIIAIARLGNNRDFSIFAAMIERWVKELSEANADIEDTVKMLKVAGRVQAFKWIRSAINSARDDSMKMDRELKKENML
jgi:hypothetical protein